MNTTAFTQGFEHFISTQGNKIMDGDKKVRFLSFNVPNLNFVEDEMAFTNNNPYRLPTEFEIRDALESVKKMGGQVVRIYTIPVRRQDQPNNKAAHVTNPGEFNEEAFKVNDLMLAIANEVGIRIIFPFLNNWKWMGGRPQYADFRGKNEDDFWTDRQLIDDMKKTIEYTLNRTNTITGIKYKDDKSVFCWETGNELDAPISWTFEMCRYIKSIDTNHLTMDGVAWDPDPETFDEPSVDIINTHHYEVNPDETIKNIKNFVQQIAGKKPYILGEFGFQSTVGLSKVMDYIISEPAIAGALVWSLRYHREEGGFYWHSEPYGHSVYKAYHYPGFPSGHPYDEIDFLNCITDKAYKIQGIENHGIPVPKASTLLPIDYQYEINWQGSAGASFYHVERADKVDGPWETIAFYVSDAAVTYNPLFHDKKAIIGKTYYYRVIAGNNTGLSKPSNTIGPVAVFQYALIDDCSNIGTLFISDNISVETGDDRKYKEDMWRFGLTKESSITYYVEGEIKEVRIYAFQESVNKILLLEESPDGKSSKSLEIKTQDFTEESDDYSALHPILYKCAEINSDSRYIKISGLGEVKISRVEIIYD